MPLRVAVLVVGAVLGLACRAVAAESVGISFASRTSWGSIYLLVVGWSAMAAAVVVLRNQRCLAVLLYSLGIWWFVGELADPAVGLALAFTLGLAMAAAGPALVAHLALSYPTGQLHGWPSTVIVASGYAVMLGVIGIAGTVTFDPKSMGCLDCPNNLLLISGLSPLLDPVTLLGAQLGAGWLLLALGAVGWRAVSTGPGLRSAVGPIAFGASVFLGGSAALYLNGLSAGVVWSGGPAAVVWHVQGISVLMLAAATCIDRWRGRRARRDLTRLVVELRGMSSGGLRAALAERLNDPELVIAYPIDGGLRHVDADAREVSVTHAHDRSVTRLSRGNVELATLVHRPGVLSQPQQVDDLVASVQLALENERLAAEDLAQLAEIRSSGARIVAAGDTERRRIERDLHDGAQQRLVALLLNLRLIKAGHPAMPPAVAEAETELRQTIADLRRIAHGVHPVLLKDAGLQAAVNGLAETRHLTLDEGTDERYPDVVELTVYLLVTNLSNAGPTSLRIIGEPRQLKVEATVEGEPRPALDLNDRIRTLGGCLHLVTSGANTRVTLVLPLDGRAV